MVAIAQQEAPPTDGILKIADYIFDQISLFETCSKYDLFYHHVETKYLTQYSIPTSL